MSVVAAFGQINLQIEVVGYRTMILLLVVKLLRTILPEVVEQWLQIILLFVVVEHQIKILFVVEVVGPQTKMTLRVEFAGQTMK